MRYFVFDIEYSQTDKEVIIVAASEKKAAEYKLKIKFPNARYYSLIRTSDYLIDKDK